MGCDIHAVIERRTDAGKWVTINTLTYFVNAYRKKGDGMHAFPAALSRNYCRFSELAGVRGEGPEPRGVPEDASETASFLIAKDGPEGHSHSWLPCSEALAIFVKTERWSDEDSLPEAWPRKYPASYFFGLEDDELAEHRLVFWFDN